MPKKRKKARPRGLAPAPMLEPNAAGVDIGATEIYIAVPPDRDSSAGAAVRDVYLRLDCGGGLA